MHLQLNGEHIDVNEEITLIELLDSYSLKPETVAIEINFEIIPRFRFGEVHLKEGDTIEIVHFVGGG
jgi:sulfur carrier protein